MARRRERKTTPTPAPDLSNAAAALPELLDRLDRWLYRRRRRMRQGLCPGLDEAGLTALRQALGTVPDELATLLAWHDGQADDFMGTFADCWGLLPAGEIIALTRDLDGDPPPGWVRGWIPFARDSGDSFLVLDPLAEGKPVRAQWSGKKEAELVAPSLTAWFATLLHDFEAGRYIEDPERGDFIRTGNTGAVSAKDAEDDTDAK